MRKKHAFWTAFWTAFRTTILSVALLSMAAQDGGAQFRRSGRRPFTQFPETMNLPSERRLNRRMLKASYEQVVKDVERLFELTAELKEEVTKANEDVMSVSGIQKAEQIEKLAKKIRNRMKNL